MKTKPPREGLETLPVIAHVTASTKAVMGAGALYQKAATKGEKKLCALPAPAQSLKLAKVNATSTAEMALTWRSLA